MSAATVRDRPAARPGAAVDDVGLAGGFLVRFAGTLVPLGLAAGLLALGWPGIAGGAAAHPWPAAVGAVVVWLLTAIWWLRRRGRRGAPTPVLLWAVPAATLAVPAAAGWLSPAGLVLWGPFSAVMAAALDMSAHPLVFLGTDEPTPHR